ncbi:MAG: NAD(P)/FAD-dependent oxidoreductase [Bacilli bacterium]|nr:NAD(P)/FAD-dependent oxidoreductase [Bacilli bacterium]
MIRIRQVKIPILKDNEETILHKIGNILKISSNQILDFSIIKKSIDARDKKNILYVYEFDVKCLEEEKVLKKNSSKDVFLSEKKTYCFPKKGNKKTNNKPIIIGSGPAGLFCSYLLAKNGYNPVVLERGEKVEDRIKTVEQFFQDNILNKESNIQFGEGGAGTFSDGKLNTLTKDSFGRGEEVLKIFVENGAPEEILYVQHPHIGTDLLRKVIVNMRNKIINWGGTFSYSSCVTNLIIENNSIVGVEINHKEKLYSNIVIMAIGHSARDTFYMLNENQIKMKPKNFAVGLRIEHPKEMIDKSQYGENYKLLDSASYKLTYQTKNHRGVYTFCMCPGGYVVNASSEEEMICCNGMSNYKRDEKNSNSAIVVTVTPNDFGNDIFSGLEFQRKLERMAYQEGKGYLPVQLYKDYVNDQISTSFKEIEPNTKGKTIFANLNNVLPKYINDSIKEAIPEFGKKIKGFDREDAILIGVETRTSSPVVIERDENYQAIPGLYPCGEGAGYAGGITTAAIDGIKVAEQIAKEYTNE